MSVAQSPTRPSKQKRKPDPSRIYESYVYAVSTVGKRRAARHVAEQYGLSDDTIRRLIAKIELVDDTPVELAYIAPDPLYDSRRTAINTPLMEAARSAHKRCLQSVHPPQNDPVTPIYVEPEPHVLPQLDALDQRHTLMSNTVDFEREMRQIRSAFTPQQPQNGMPQTRTTEREQQPHDSTANPQISTQPVTSIGHMLASEKLTTQDVPRAMEATRPVHQLTSPSSMHADYVRQRTVPKQRPAPVFNMHTIVAQFLQPGPILAVVLFVILLGLMYWK